MLRPWLRTATGAAGGPASMARFELTAAAGQHRTGCGPHGRGLRAKASRLDQRLDRVMTGQIHDTGITTAKQPIAAPPVGTLHKPAEPPARHHLLAAGSHIRMPAACMPSMHAITDTNIPSPAGRVCNTGSPGTLRMPRVHAQAAHATAARPPSI